MDTLIEAKNKIQITVVRNYGNTSHEKDGKSGLYVERALPVYDLKKIVGAADVRLPVGPEGKVKAFLVGSTISHEELEDIAHEVRTFEVTVIDAQRVA